MKKTLILILLIAVSFHCFAERWICGDMNGISKRVEGDGYKLGICGKNNSNITQSCFLATPQDWELSKNQYTKVENSQVVNMTQTEIDLILQTQADAQLQAEIDRIDRLELTIPELIQALEDLGDLGNIKKDDIKEKVKLNKGL